MRIAHLGGSQTTHYGQKTAAGSEMEAHVTGPGDDHRVHAFDVLDDLFCASRAEHAFHGLKLRQGCVAGRGRPAHEYCDNAPLRGGCSEFRTEIRLP